MKSIIEKSTKKPFRYPCILQSGESIVLFKAPNEGTLLRDSGNCKAGEYREDWAMHFFYEFDGTITLSND
jgi:hypothetical protein